MVFRLFPSDDRWEACWQVLERLLARAQRDKEDNYGWKRGRHCECATWPLCKGHQWCLYPSTMLSIRGKGWEAPCHLCQPDLLRPFHPVITLYLAPSLAPCRAVSRCLLAVSSSARQEGERLHISGDIGIFGNSRFAKVCTGFLAKQVKDMIAIFQGCLFSSSGCSSADFDDHASIPSSQHMETLRMRCLLSSLKYEVDWSRNRFPLWRACAREFSQANVAFRPLAFLAHFHLGRAKRHPADH